MEFLNNSLITLASYSPLGVIGIYRWSVWFFKKIIAKKYKPVPENGYTDTMSLIVPVYNEDPDIFQRALNSWETNKPDEIIAVIDYTDKACIEIFQNFQEKNKIGKLIITERPGKRAALADGIRAAQYNIISLVDSDTIWDPNIKNTLLYPFKDPSIGGVGPRQDVLDTNTLARRLFNIHLDHRYFDEMTYLTVVSNALPCLSGRTALYRKEAVKDLCYDLENEKFLGVTCISGDDKCLTRLVQQKGWKVRYQANARVLTTGAADLKTLFKQYIRWTRNSFSSDLKSLMSTWIWKREKFLAYHMIDRFTQPFTLMLGPIYLFFSIIWGDWLITAILLIWWHVSRAIKIYPHLKHRPSDIVILPLYVLSTYYIGILKIYALVTMRQMGWITRWDKNRLGTKDGYVFQLLKKIPAYSATLFLMALLFVAVGEFRDPSRSYDTAALIDSRKVDINKSRGTILDSLTQNKFAYYKVKSGDNLSTISWKWNIDVNTILKHNEKISDPNLIITEDVISIPNSELKNRIQKTDENYIIEPKISFDLQNNTIHVKGEKSLVNLSKIDAALKNQQILQKLGEKEWILRSNLFLEKDTTLVLEGYEVSWLKLYSQENSFAIIRANNSRILIENTKITSWNESSGDYDKNINDGRSFIIVRDEGRMDIANSELAYLGYGHYKVSSKEPYGGSYGISWKTLDDSLNKYLMTGTVTDSKIHDNYLGIYTLGGTGMIFSGNEIFNNISNGIDLNKQSNNNVLENNIIYRNMDAIVISNSSYNIVRGNEIRENDNNIKIDNSSSENYIEENMLLDR